MAKCINEMYAVCTEDTRIMVSVFDDGHIEKQFEQYLIKDGIIEMINHCNRDENGNRYTTRKTIHLSLVGWKNWQDEYKAYCESEKRKRLTPEEINREYEKEALLRLAESEKMHRENGHYRKTSDTYKYNAIRRIKKYIDRHCFYKNTVEYQIFINSMKESLDMLI